MAALQPSSATFPSLSGSSRMDDPPQRTAPRQPDQRIVARHSVYPVRTTSHTQTLSNLSAGTTYHYRVRSKDGAGNEGISIDSTFTTLPAPDTTPPAAITTLAATAVRKTSADLSWTAPGDDGTSGTALSYDIRSSRNPITESVWGTATQATGEPSPAAPATTQTYTLVGLNNNATYYVAMKTQDEAGNISAISNTVTFKTLKKGIADASSSGAMASVLGSLAQAAPEEPDDTTPPGNVTNFMAHGAHTQVLLSWKNPTDPDYVRTLIVRKQGSPARSLTDGTVIYEGTAASYTDTNLENNTAYYYTAYAFDYVPNYSSGVTVSATPKAGVVSVGASPRTVKAMSWGMITRALARGIRHGEVANLQAMLIAQGFLASSNDTGYFGNLTEAAVKQFQCRNNVVCVGFPAATGWGRVGPRTRALLNSISL